MWSTSEKSTNVMDEYTIKDAAPHVWLCGKFTTQPHVWRMCGKRAARTGTKDASPRAVVR
jgi:hypothetical protein